MSGPRLRAIGWNHPRCTLPMGACAREWQRMGHSEILWDVRSLEAFGDEPLEQIAGRYDLLVIDHPFCGAAARSGCLVPFDELLSPQLLAEASSGAVGPSQSSYRYAGRTWALASDAACQVSAFAGARPDPAPRSWPEAIAQMRSLKRRTALPLSPAHAISSLLTLWAGAGLRPGSGADLVDPELGLQPLEWLLEMHRLGHPAATAWEPPQALDALTTGQIDYVPLTYGYISYSTRGGTAAPCRFDDLPGVSGAVLGGAGLAISSASEHPQEAAAFAVWACGADAQMELVARSGGQPANRGCWEDPSLDAEAGYFYSGTRATIEAAWVRPRDAWWPGFQLEAGRALTIGLEQQTPAPQLLEQLIAIHHEKSELQA